ncbi:hypothetical protein B0T22DRAFT_443897 [Podospora appendiculata]|uniref:Uncharacterized protein n=1 Tax=Podospora appendiculata TaxID=314037 RepID=A0AAE1C979_9PEZI|nr:hypothetical protein B0T22DRAFT_443897 [Podospora appendiculata]
MGPPPTPSRAASTSLPPGISPSSSTPASTSTADETQAQQQPTPAPASASATPGTGPGPQTDGATSGHPLLLPPSSSSSSTVNERGERTTTLEINGGAVALDHLGPMVIGRDGTISRIANWAELTAVERDNTLRVLGRRNQLRIASLLRDQEQQEQK